MKSVLLVEVPAISESVELITFKPTERKLSNLIEIIVFFFLWYSTKFCPSKQDGFYLDILLVLSKNTFCFSLPLNGPFSGLILCPWLSFGNEMHMGSLI